MTSLPTAAAATPADLIRDAVALMRTTWRVRGDFIIGRLTTGHGFCPVAAVSSVAGDVFVRGVPLGRLPIVQDTMTWLVTYHRLPRSKPEIKAGTDDPRLAYVRVAEWADSFTEAQDEALYARLEEAANAWLPSAYPVGGTADRKRRS